MNNDLISRSDLLKDINSYFYDTVDQDTRRIEHIVKAHICELIEKQPQIGEWISCSERLPEEYDNMLAKLVISNKDDGKFKRCSDIVNVTVVDGKGHSITTYARRINGQWNCDLLRLNKAYKIIAWQPLPKPYQPESEGDNA